MKNIRLSGAKNVRDLGGIQVKGGVIRSGMLLRASHLAAITEHDSDKLVDEYNLRTVIDLRNLAEKSEKPDVIIPGVNYLEMPIFDSSIPGMSHESKQDVDNIPSLTDIYRYVANSECLDRLADVVRKIALSEDGYAYLYHCTEGKDRTGMVTALLLTLLGADRATILEDYLYTNKVNRKKAVGYFLLVRIFKHNKSASRKVYRVFLAQEEYINELFRVIDGVGEERFISEVLKLTPSEVSAFRERLIIKR